MTPTMKSSPKTEAIESFSTDVYYKSPATSALFKGSTTWKSYGEDDMNMLINDGYTERKASIKFQGSGKSSLSDEEHSMMMNIDNLLKVIAKDGNDLANANSKKKESTVMEINGQENDRLERGGGGLSLLIRAINDDILAGKAWLLDEQNESQLESKGFVGNKRLKLMVKDTNNPITGPSKFECKKCGKVLESYQALGGHASSHRKKKVVKIYNTIEHLDDGNIFRLFKVCDVCKKVFTRLAFEGHKKLHSCADN